MTDKAKGPTLTSTERSKDGKTLILRAYKEGVCLGEATIDASVAGPEFHATVKGWLGALAGNPATSGEAANADSA